jgi:hypothetical protein
MTGAGNSWAWNYYHGRYFFHEILMQISWTELYLFETKPMVLTTGQFETVPFQFSQHPTVLLSFDPVLY